MTKNKKVKKEDGTEEETGEMDTHKGNLFFPLPNGTALLYRLNGTATKPDADGEIKDTVQAKKAKSITVPLKNWSHGGQPQRFTAKWDIESEKDPACFIRGANTFDVGANSTKEYKLNFLALKAGTYKFKVTFQVEKTGEYAFYNVIVTVTEADIIRKIELVSQVRESVS